MTGIYYIVSGIIGTAITVGCWFTVTTDPVMLISVFLLYSAVAYFILKYESSTSNGPRTVVALLGFFAGFSWILGSYLIEIEPSQFVYGALFMGFLLAGYGTGIAMQSTKQRAD